MVGLAIGMALSLPAYYIIAAHVPGLTELVPPFIVHVLMALGLLVVFPATLIYARVLERKPVEQGPESSPKYGVNDQWERRNL